MTDDDALMGIMDTRYVVDLLADADESRSMIGPFVTRVEGGTMEVKLARSYLPMSKGPGLSVVLTEGGSITYGRHRLLIGKDEDGIFTNYDQDYGVRA